MLVVSPVGIWSFWDDAGASASLLHHQMFLMGVALVCANIAITLALVRWWKEVGAWLIAAHLLIMGLYIGLAVATTNWPAWTMRGWWQFWWAFPLLGGQIGQVLKLLRARPNLRPRSFRLVNGPTDAVPQTSEVHP